MPLLIRECKGCHHRFEVVSIGGTMLSQDRTGPGEDPEDLSCVKCGATDLDAIIGTPMESSRKYPYFDRGLGREITSYRHWRQVCAELGVVPTEGETIGTWDDIADKEESARQRDEGRYRAYEREMKEGPARAEYARLEEHLAQEQGRMLAQVQADRKRQMEEYEAEVAELRARRARAGR